MNDALFIDIETVPAHSGYELLTPDWQSLWIAKLSKTMPENFDPAETYHQRAGIMAEFGRIVCVASGYFSEDKTTRKTLFKVKPIAGSDEKELLTEWVRTVDKFCAFFPAFRFVGHNIKEFDIPYLCRRLMALGIPLPKYLQISGMKPWETNLVDTMHQWRFGDTRHYVSLDLLAHTLGIPTPKDDIDGSQVQRVFYEDGDIERIKTYCVKDVVTTARVMQKFRGQEPLKDEDIVIV
jgi:predicted PolB exonuclease-like 3'-5' exonuclease